MVTTGENEYRILLALSEGDKRFNELLREVKKASLARELNELEERKLVQRTVKNTKPPGTFYAITRLGTVSLLESAEARLPKLELELARLRGILPEKIKAIKNKL